MKATVILMRHAKSSWKSAVSTDRERPLNKRGMHDAPMMGARLAAAGYRPAQIVTSPAKRAVATAEAAARALGFEAEIAVDERLYMADEQTLLMLVKTYAAEGKTTLVVSHNPLLGEVAAIFGIEHFPTASYLALSVSGDARGFEDAVLLEYDYPKSTRAPEAG